MSTNSQSPQGRWSPSDLIEPDVKKKSSLTQRWNELTSIPDAPPDADFARRENVRKSQMTSNI